MVQRVVVAGPTVGIIAACLVRTFSIDRIFRYNTFLWLIDFGVLFHFLWYLDLTERKSEKFVKSIFAGADRFVASVVSVTEE